MKSALVGGKAFFSLQSCVFLVEIFLNFSFILQHVHQTAKMFNQNSSKFFFLFSTASCVDLKKRQARTQLINVTWKYSKENWMKHYLESLWICDYGTRKSIFLYFCLAFFSIEQLQILASYLHLMPLAISPFCPKEKRDWW